MTKIEKYRRLVEKRKACQLCTNITNPSKVENGRYDSNEIGPWSLWQGNLNAELLIVGQDWGDTSYLKRWKGRDQPSGNKTNENLQKLLAHIGVRIGKPRDSKDQIVFFTNLILCLKEEGGLQGPIKNDWLINCAKEFFLTLLEIIKPRAILALGKDVSETILKLYKIQYRKNQRLSELMNRSPYRLTTSMVLFPLYHCGARGQNINRPNPESDWIRIKKWLINNKL